MPLLVLLAALALPAAAQVDLPEAQPSHEPIVISAEAACRWKQGTYEIWILRGNCQIRQGQSSTSSREAVLWIDHANPLELRPKKVIAYLEGEVAVQQHQQDQRAKLTDQSWFGRCYTSGAVEVHAAQVAGQPSVVPEVYRRGLAQFDPGPRGGVRQAQFVEPPGAKPQAVSLPPGTRRIRAFPRSNAPVQAVWFPDPQSNQQIAMISAGVNLIVDGLPGFGSIDVSADRLVIWTRGLKELGLTGDEYQDEKLPLEIYLEGNIVFRQGERIIYADRMYYDVANHVGTVLNADVLTPFKNYEGLLRLHAEIVQQTGPDHFFAREAFVTSSRMGRPGYRIQSGDIEFEDLQFQAVEPWTGQPILNPQTGEPMIEHRRLASSQNNFLFVGPVPIFYWPTLATDLEDPTFYLRRARVKNDTIFGTQVLTDWNMFQLLGIRRKPAGTDWDLSIDYLSKRGLGHGSTFKYRGEQFLGIPGPAGGIIDFWGIKDDGTDTLGSDRVNLQPEADYRFKLFGQHRQQLAGGFQVTAEVGYLSDRNFLQQFFQEEWDELKDQSTGIELKRIRENTSWSITADLRLNQFFTQTEWLPRADHFWLGQPLLGDALSWFEHSSIGYGRMRQATAPTNPADQPFSYLPWERSSQSGERLATRQEIDWPLQLGPVKVVPYALGEAAHWGEDIDGEPLQRLYGQVGVRASLPVWRISPNIESGLWNVHGVAHKVSFEAEFLWAEANRDLSQLPLYDPLDDDSIEAFRRRFATNTFGSPSLIPPTVAVIPLQFDERFYALRTGMAGWVTAPSTEVADDLLALRMGIHQRWQTKRGMPGNRRIIDWIIFDTNFTWFPNESRDNFERALGLLDYNFRWHVGDRLTLLSEGLFDFFQDGQQVITVGGFLSRPPRGSLYLGMRLLQGPINSQVLTTSYSYWMSPKWVSSFGMSVDLGNQYNVGQNFNITRVGESLLVSAGFTVDAARNNVGVNFVVEPRFLPNSRLANVGGAHIPPAGAFGLE